MSKIKLSYIVIFIIAIAITIGFANIDTENADVEDPTVESESFEAFDTMMEAVMHKRCTNCHPSGDQPRQGEDSHLHYFGVKRGEDNQGLAGYQCSTCHGKENNNYSGVPGAPHWGLAPIEFAWEGKTKIEIANQMMDPKRNGGRTHDDILHHMTEDALVLWAWEPGVDAEGVEREKPPVSKEAYIAAVKEWIAGGAIIPSE